jgi:tRNA threonylcarbamoyladenosine biosynthesis protein TsaE
MANSAVTEGPLLDIVSHGAEQTRRLGAHLGAAARKGDVVLLEGEFGSGKTTFTQGIARGLGIDAHYVNSPTFMLINEYRGRQRLYHIDLYRLEDEEQVSTLGLDDYFDGSGITVIEWPEQAAPWLPDDRLVIRFGHLSDTKRTLRFFPQGERAQELVRDFKRDAFGM